MLQLFLNDVFKAKKKFLAQPLSFLCSIGISAPNQSSSFPPL